MQPHQQHFGGRRPAASGSVLRCHKTSYALWLEIVYKVGSVIIMIVIVSSVEGRSWCRLGARVASHGLPALR